MRLGTRSLTLAAQLAFPALLLGALAIPANAQGPPAAEGASTPTEDMQAWQYFCEIAPPADVAEGAWLDFILDRPVISEARTDLADLRLLDSQGRAIPFGVRVRSPHDDYEVLPAKEFNRGSGPEKSIELSLDLGPDPAEHNQVQVKLSGENFRHHVIVSGSNDDQQWTQLADAFVVRFEGNGQKIDDDNVNYPASRFRYLRLRIDRDPVADADHPFEVISTAVRRRIQRPGENLVFEAKLGPREPVRVFRQPGSAWLIDLEGQNIPCHTLLFTIDDADFVRRYELETRTPPESFNPFASVQFGEWRRRQDQPLKPMEIETGDLLASELRLKVQDVGNPPLHMRSVKVSAPAREVVFRWPAVARGPLRLYFGNPRAESPQYDFARNLPILLPEIPTRLPLEARQANPDYVPPPLPLTERWPWAIYVVLGAACLVLALVIASVGRQAMALADARPSAG